MRSRSGFNYGATPLHFACANGHINTIRVLVSELGADLTAPVLVVRRCTLPLRIRRRSIVSGSRELAEGFSVCVEGGNSVVISAFNAEVVPEFRPIRQFDGCRTKNNWCRAQQEASYLLEPTR